MTHAWSQRAYACARWIGSLGIWTLEMTILGQLGPTWGQLGLTWTLGLTWSFGYDHLGSTRANLGPTWVNLDPWANLDQTLEMSPAPWSAITMLITCYSHAPWSAITYHAHYLLLSCSVVCDYRACWITAANRSHHWSWGGCNLPLPWEMHDCKEYCTLHVWITYTGKCSTLVFPFPLCVIIMQLMWFELGWVELS